MPFGVVLLQLQVAIHIPNEAVGTVPGGLLSAPALASPFGIDPQIGEALDPQRTSGRRAENAFMGLQVPHGTQSAYLLGD